MNNKESIFAIDVRIWIRAYDKDEAKSRFFDEMVLPSVLTGFCTDHSYKNIEYFCDDNFQETNRIIRKTVNDFINEYRKGNPQK